MHFGQKNNPNRQPTPAWFKLMLVGFVLYAFATHDWSEKGKTGAELQPIAAAKKAINAVAPGTVKETAPTAAAPSKPAAVGEVNPDKTSSDLISQLLPDLRIEDIKTGAGAPAICGQTVALRYDAYASDGTKIASNREAPEPLRFTIGRHEVMAAWERGVLGMKKGGTRQVISPSSMAYSGAFANDRFPATRTVTFDLEVADLSPLLPDSPLQTRIFPLFPGGGAPVQCGDPITIALVVWKSDGTAAFQSSQKLGDAPKAFTFTTGAGEVPVGLEQGVIGMAPGEMRTVIVPPSYLKRQGAYAKPATPPPSKNPLANVPIPANQTVIMDIIRLTPDVMKRAESVRQPEKLTATPSEPPHADPSQAPEQH